jgi:UDP-N-acetyl-D-galactosamine dehydrogenase
LRLPKLRFSQSNIIRELQNWGLKVKVTETWANAHEVQEEYGVELTTITSDAPVDSLISAVAHQEFASLSTVQLKALSAANIKPVIADLKALLNREALEEQGFEVFRL